MSYDDLLPWRALAQRIPKDVLNPTHRLIILTLMTYESQDKGAFFTPENIANELGLSYRAVMDNFHYLGSGKVWKDGNYRPCQNPECKRHLGIIKTSYYAKRNRAQTYRLDQQAIKDLASVHSGAPINESMNLDAIKPAPEDVKPAPEDVKGCAEPQAYKHNKHLININKRKHEINYERWQVITSGLSENVKRFINPAPNTELLLDKLERQGTRLETVRDVLAKVNFSTSHKIGGLFVKTLEDLAGVKSVRENSAVPWCGKCDKETRQFAEASIINDVETYNCPTCSPYAKQLKIRRDVEPNEFQKRISNLLKSVED